jgi:succinoglycan biosynthesis protein ExoL
MKLAYFVHDLHDPAVHRRMRMLHTGGANISLLGFTRGTVPPDPGKAEQMLCFGQTYNAHMTQRTMAVLRAARTIERCRDEVTGADVIMARQLETLVLAAIARRRFAPAARLVFECLDVHRLMLARGPIGHALRMIEGRLLRRCDLLLVSSPAFATAYFANAHADLPPVRVVENRILASELTMSATAATPPGPPWRIGWFGVIRCRRSLAILAQLVRTYPGLVEVVIRGRPARDTIPDFDAIIGATPGLRFLGPYDRATDLAQIYADVHFVWTIDYYEAGANSTWLLPNRLYEGGVYGAVPIALRAVETGQWLIRQKAGICLDEPLDDSLAEFVTMLDTTRYAAVRTTMQRIPQDAFICDTAACRELTDALADSRATTAERAPNA